MPNNHIFNSTKSDSHSFFFHFSSKTWSIRPHSHKIPSSIFKYNEQSVLPSRQPPESVITHNTFLALFPRCFSRVIQLLFDIYLFLSRFTMHCTSTDAIMNIIIPYRKISVLKLLFIFRSSFPPSISLLHIIAHVIHSVLPHGSF